MKKILLLFLLTSLVVACDSADTLTGGSPTQPGYDYPLARDRELQQERGRITGSDGLVIFGGSSDDSESGSAGIGVSGYLWRATLDTLSFMPLASADPFGGVVITDWYENPQAPGERFKANALILSQTLRTDGIQVKLFKQQQDANGNWRDVAGNPSLARQLEDTILTRARELRVAAGK